VPPDSPAESEAAEASGIGLGKQRRRTWIISGLIVAAVVTGVIVHNSGGGTSSDSSSDIASSAGVTDHSTACDDEVNTELDITSATITTPALSSRPSARTTRSTPS
jgi:hypothetical protein